MKKAYIVTKKLKKVSRFALTSIKVDAFQNANIFDTRPKPQPSFHKIYFTVCK